MNLPRINEVYRTRKGSVLMIQQGCCYWVDENLNCELSGVKPGLVRKFKNIFTLIGNNLRATPWKTANKAR